MLLDLRRHRHEAYILVRAARGPQERCKRPIKVQGGAPGAKTLCNLTATADNVKLFVKQFGFAEDCVLI